MTWNKRWSQIEGSRYIGLYFILFIPFMLLKMNLIFAYRVFTQTPSKLESARRVWEWACKCLVEIILYYKSLYLHYLLLLRSFILSIWRVVLEKYGSFFRILIYFLLIKLVLKYGDLCCTAKKLLWVGYCICIIPSSGLLQF